MRLPLLDPRNPKSIDIDHFKRMVDVFMERGFTYFDTAYTYHQSKSEAAFRMAVQERFPRDRFTLTDKMPMWEVKQESDYERLFNVQLQRTGVEYFDYYWFHTLNKGYVDILDRTNGWDFALRKQKEGRVKNIGFSFHDDSPTLERILKEHPEMEYVQLQINYVDWDSPSIESARCYELCEKYGRKVVVMEPVKGGSLAQIPSEVEAIFKEHSPEASLASWAIRFAASLPNVVMVLSGMSELSQVEDNTSFMADFRPLDEEEQLVLARAAGMIKNSIAIPCTSCHYCTDGCPMNIAIPEYFAIYNSLKQFGKTSAFNSRFYFNRISEYRGKPSDCIECGQCEEHCPQHLPIISNLKLVSGEYEKN